jgi:hypothetical protein
VTGPEIVALLKRVNGTWPQSPVTPEMAAAWTDRLRSVDVASAQAAYDALLNKGSAFTPSLSEFVATIAEVEQGPPPTAEQLDEVLRRNASKWPYRGHVSAHEHTQGAIRQLMSVGAHEAVCRFVQQVGGREAAEMPDAAQGISDQGASVRRHELLKTYREQSVASWRADPTRGLALQRATERAGLDPGGAPRRLGDALKALPSGD